MTNGETSHGPCLPCLLPLVAIIPTYHRQTQILSLFVFVIHFSLWIQLQVQILQLYQHITGRPLRATLVIWTGQPFRIGFQIHISSFFGRAFGVLLSEEHLDSFWKNILLEEHSDGGRSESGLRVRGMEPGPACQSGSPTQSCQPVPCGTLGQNVFVQITKCICQNCKMYVSKLHKCFCSNCTMYLNHANQSCAECPDNLYLSRLLNIFIRDSKHNCPKFQMCCPKLKYFFLLQL